MSNRNSYNYILASINNNIEYYRNMIENSSALHERFFYKSKLYNEKIRLINHMNQGIRLSQENLTEEKVFNALELAQYDGLNGKSAYVAINGTVYDVSLVAVWEGGTHFGLYAGKDLSEYYNTCHASRLEVLKNLPIVGAFQE